MRGVSFCIPSKYSKYLWDILKFIDFSKYSWFIEQEEILYFNEKKGKPDSDFFTNNILTGDEFKKRITDDDYYIYLANIKAYPVNEKVENIVVYDDFIKGCCEMLLLCADSKYIDLYCKSEEYIKTIYDMSIQNGFENVEYITDENDARTRLRL